MINPEGRIAGFIFRASRYIALENANLSASFAVNFIRAKEMMWLGRTIKLALFMTALIGAGIIWTAYNHELVLEALKVPEGMALAISNSVLGIILFINVVVWPILAKLGSWFIHRSPAAHASEAALKAGALMQNSPFSPKGGTP